MTNTHIQIWKKNLNSFLNKMKSFTKKKSESNMLKIDFE